MLQEGRGNRGASDFSKKINGFNLNESDEIDSSKRGGGKSPLCYHVEMAKYTCVIHMYIRMLDQSD